MIKNCRIIDARWGTCLAWISNGGRLIARDGMSEEIAEDDANSSEKRKATSAHKVHDGISSQASIPSPPGTAERKKNLEKLGQ